MTGGNSGYDRAFPVAFAALTRVHPGSGRSPGLVDLPVVRDSLGYPFLPGSSLKGALKTLYARREGCITVGGTQGVVACGGNKGGCKWICCLFGRDEQGGSEGIGSVLVGDAYPVFLPLPAAPGGVVYATSPYLLARAAEMLKAAGMDGEASSLESMASSAKDGPIIAGSGGDGMLYVGMERVKAKTVDGGLRLEVLDEIAGGLHAFYNTVRPSEALLVVPEDTAIGFVEKALVRMTRVRLDRETKTVVGRALWTEEYLPQGTLFLGLVADTGFRNDYCNNENIEARVSKVFPRDGVGYVIVGGKESTGGGLLKYKRLR